MIQFQFSKRLQAILPLENYNLILNEQSRQKKNTHSLNVIKFEEFENHQLTRRKSCVCSECGNQSQFQFKTMNFPFRQLKQKLLIQHPIINQPLLEIRKSVFFHKFSLPVHEKDSRNNMELQFQIHGIKKSSQYRDSIQRMTSPGQDRLKRLSSSVHSSESIDSQGLIASANSLMSLHQPLSPKSAFFSKGKNQIIQPQISKTFDTSPKIHTNLYLKTSLHKAFIQPITRILNGQLQKSNSLPRIQVKKQVLFRMKTVV